MSKIIDLIATLVGAGVVGYFGYAVILPKLNAQLPQLQLPAALAPTPSVQQPITELPSVIESPSSSDEESAPMMTAPTTGAGQLIYDSSKGWTGVTTAASGSPKWTTEPGGIGKLSCGSGHCRVYIAVKNYNARMEGEYMYSGAVSNLSLRLRSRHQEGGACTNRFGGFGAAIYPDGAVKFQTESCHNNHENTINGKTQAVPAGKWHKFAYSCYDSPDKRSVNFKLDVNGQTVLTGKHPSPKPYYMDEALHMKNSYVWLRSNNSGSGNISFRNFRVYNLGGSGAGATNRTLLMHNQPYLYNRFYHGRRM